MNYKYNRKLITTKCDGCGIDFEKPESEYKRNLNLNRRNYCTRSCVGKHNNKHLKQYDSPDISIYAKNRIDNYTPYKYYMKNVKKRFKYFNITLKDLEDQWIKQKGICPYSGVNLILSTHSTVNKDTIYSASLDRIDSELGYLVGNIQFVSIAINYMKGVMSHNDTLKLCNIIANNYKN